MKLDKLSRMKKGWFIGNFEPACVRTKHFEVAYKKHKRREFWPWHHQKEATEINLLVRGHLKLKFPFKKDVQLKPGTIFIFPPKEAAKPIFLTNCELVVIKIPSLPKDKVQFKL